MENQRNEYEDIDKLVTNQNQMLDNALEQQNNIIDKSTQMNVQRLEQNKADIDKEVDKTNRGIYQEYRKASNPYGYNAEALASRGLGNSGYAESTQAKMYNTYQGNITNTMNNARDLKANFDFEINQAMQSGDLAKAQNAFDIYNQKMQLLAQEYQLRNNREQYLYQKEQDALAQSNWQDQFNYQKEQDTRNYNYQLGRDKVADERYNKEFDYQKNRDAISDERYNNELAYQKERNQVADERYQQEWEYQKARDAINDNRYLTEQERQRRLDDLEEQWRQKQFEYQKQQDALSQSNWEREYELQKKSSESRGSGGYYSSGSSSSSENTIYPTEDTGASQIENILSNARMIQGPIMMGPHLLDSVIYDENSGQYFKSRDELLEYYGL